MSHKRRIGAEEIIRVIRKYKAGEGNAEILGKSQFDFVFPAEYNE